MSDLGPMTARVDQASAELRDFMDEHYPLHASLLRERSPWHDGARFILQYLMERRGDQEALIAALWAWDSYLIPGDT